MPVLITKRNFSTPSPLALRISKASKTDVPVKDIKKLVSFFGGEIKVGNSNTPLVKTGRNSFNIYINDWNYPLFRKFYIAARLGDLFLHTNYLSDHDAYLESKAMIFKRDNWLTSQADQSNEFAYGLLMPRFIYEDVLHDNTEGDVVYTKNIADYFEVPVSAASGRGKRLGLLKD